MPRPRSSIPRLCRNAKGYLFAKSRDGKQHWFGHESDPSSRQKYAEFLIQSDQPSDVRENTPLACSVNEVCLAFLTKYAIRYRNADGKPTAELDCFKSAIRVLRPLFGETAATDFGPLKLRKTREAMVSAGWCRKFINKQVRRIRMMFRFAISLELIPSGVLVALDTLPPLAEGESAAPDYEPRRAVPEADLKAVRGLLDEYNRDLFDLMLLTGARPGELHSLTSGMIVRTGDVWRVDMRHHKTAKRGKSRTLFFNKLSQAILLRHLKAAPDSRLFPTRRDRFSKIVQRACIKAEVPAFCPHQLRHVVATRLTDEQGIESAQRLLGHSTAAMTQHYSLAAEKLAISAVRSLQGGALWFDAEGA